MVRQSIAVLVVAGLLAQNAAQAARLSAFNATGSSQAPASRKPTVKEQASNILAGSLVIVRLKNGDEIRGQLRSVSDEGVVLKLTKKKQMEERKIEFSKAKSISVAKQHSRAYRIGVPIAIVGGILMGIALIALAAGLGT